LWTLERRTRILELLRSAERAKTADIAQHLGVSRETVRRDLLDMHADGLIQRVHGGARAFVDEPEAEFNRRKALNWPQKLEIGRKALSLLSPGMVIYIDAGSTTLALAQGLRSGPPVKVITNSIDVAQLLSEQALLLGGRMVNDVPATSGELTLREIESFIADFAFVSPTAVSSQHGPMYFELHESEVARAMCRNARRVAVLADHSKLGTTSRVASDSGGVFDVLITDQEAPESIKVELAGRFKEIR
jgi:DeoR family transcriptional regulator, fructose operon transcriptional repressor